jgi:phosphatidylserine/phosphatidylglycerophosphate/cardiolipin synthase-like enzyme
MRNLVEGNVLKVRAIGGLHVVTLAWDFVEGQDAKKNGLLGFAIERSEYEKNGKEVERYYLRGIKRFEHKDEGAPPGSPLPTSEHPIQSLQWGDYTAKPATSYGFVIIPVYGKPKLLDLDRNSATTVKITTEPEVEPGPKGETRHNIYFNRGVAGSQAYARKFGKTRPDQDKPESEQMKWLSRGLFEALTGFIGRAAGKDASDYKLRAMLYEFRYLPVGQAFKEAADAGADVAIRYEAQSYIEDNEAMIAEAKIKRLCKPQKSRAGIRHNKFIVLIHMDKPVAVWTGSTNISAGGIFGHSNVGHEVWDEEIAKRYLAYWERLAEPDVTRGPLVKENLAVEPTPTNVKLADDRILTLYSPRDDKEELETLHWYADLMDSANHIMCMTFAFNLDELFEKVLLKKGDTLRYAVFDKNLKKDVADQIDDVRNTVIASGAILKEGDLENFIGERLTGFNKNRYIHDKFILVDPLKKRPIVVTGTANFSGPSQSANDENMLAIPADTRVADVYFGEFMRIFDHLYARYIVGVMQEKGTSDPKAGFLKEKTEDWLPANFKEGGRKDLRRRYFMED